MGSIKLRKYLVFLIAALAVTGLYNTYKPLPEGLSAEGRVWRVTETSVKFLSDLTYTDGKGDKHYDQEIFDEILKIISGAKKYILVDMFLYNPYTGKESSARRRLSEELTASLIKKKKEIPQIKIMLISDPINNIYGAKESAQFAELEKAGVAVIITDLKKLRDTNLLYSPFWRMFVSWFGNSDKKGLAPNPFNKEGEKVAIRTYLEMFNFKANHRKLIVADSDIGGRVKIASLITSANPHDASSGHDNVALRIDDHIWKDIIISENAVAKMSSFGDNDFGFDLAIVDDSDGEVDAQFLTEKKIEKKLVEIINEARDGDNIDIAMFYLSDREIIKPLIKAGKRGVKVRLMLDPNKDAFGYKKIGIPNRQVANEMSDNSAGKIQIRWCDTHGEQCHSKMILANKKNGYEMVIGSANFTRRNLDDYNLEADVYLKSKNKIKAFADAYEYFEKAWSNKDGSSYTVDYEKYRESSLGKYIIYQIQERIGLSSF